MPQTLFLGLALGMTGTFRNSEDERPVRRHLGRQDARTRAVGMGGRGAKWQLCTLHRANE